MGNAKKLISAIEECDRDQVKKLLQSGVDLHYKGEFAIVIACEIGDKKIIKMLIDAGADVNTHIRKPFGETHGALFAAVVNENHQAVKVLLEAGATLDQHEYLEDACLGDRPQIAYTLINAGVKITEAAFCATIRNKKTSLFKTLLKHADKEIALSQKVWESAYHYGQWEIAEILLEQGVNINHQDREGRAALHMAVQDQELKAIKMLLSAGADISLCSDFEGTPLEIAEDTPKICQLLIANADQKMLDKAKEHQQQTKQREKEIDLEGAFSTYVSDLRTRGKSQEKPVLKSNSQDELASNFSKMLGLVNNLHEAELSQDQTAKDKAIGSFSEAVVGSSLANEKDKPALEQQLSNAFGKMFSGDMEALEQVDMFSLMGVEPARKKCQKKEKPKGIVFVYLVGSI